MSAAPVHQVAEPLLELLEPVESLTPFPGNPRRGDVPAIERSLRRLGQYKPLTVNRRTGHVLAGNHTLEAARRLGWSHVAVSYVDVDDDEAATIVATDNRLSDLAEYDAEALFELLEGLDDLEGTGFTAADVAALSGGDEPAALTDPDDAPEKPAAPVTLEGDLWLLGHHRVWCGRAEDTAGVRSALAGAVPDAVWTDPPYGVEYVGGTKDKLRILNDDKAGLPELLLGAFRTLVELARPGAPVYVAHADTERLTFERAMLEAGLLVRQNLVWVKSSIVLGRSDYHWRHEPVLEGEVPGAEVEPETGEEPELGVVTEHDPVLYGFTPGGKGRLGRGGARWYGDNRQSTVFEVPKPPRSDVHPTMKPVELVQRMLANSLEPGGLVLDLFGGSGSTLIAAHHHRSRAMLVELDPSYVDVICRRWQEHTGIVPVRASSKEQVDFAGAA